MNLSEALLPLKSDDWSRMHRPRDSRGYFPSLASNVHMTPFGVWLAEKLWRVELCAHRNARTSLVVRIWTGRPHQTADRKKLRVVWSAAWSR